MDKEFIYNPILFDNGKEANGTVYSDRLLQWDHEKHDSLCKKHFNNTGQYWTNREPRLIEAFLRDYLADQDIILCKVEELKNMSTGYPVWRFDYIQKITRNL